jgi:hypothetical protein
MKLWIWSISGWWKPHQAIKNQVDRGFDIAAGQQKYGNLF